MTAKEARQIAREFVADHVKTGRQWSTRTLESYLPRDLRFRDGADYAGPATIEDIAAFVRREVTTT